MTRRLLSLAFAAALVLSACGGSSAPTSSPPTTQHVAASPLSTAGLPSRALTTLGYIDEHHNPPDGYVGGSTYQNDGRGGGQTLPQKDAHGATIAYQEWDVNPHMQGVNRGAERLITGSDGSAYYTDDHYDTFRRIR